MRLHIGRVELLKMLQVSAKKRMRFVQNVESAILRNLLNFQLYKNHLLCQRSALIVLD